MLLVVPAFLGCFPPYRSSPVTLYFYLCAYVCLNVRMCAHVYAGASERVFQLMDREPQVRFTGGRCPDAVEGLVSFENVGLPRLSRTFSRAVLSNVHISILF